MSRHPDKPKRDPFRTLDDPAPAPMTPELAQQFRTLDDPEGLPAPLTLMPMGEPLPARWALWRSEEPNAWHRLWARLLFGSSWSRY